MLSFGLDEVLHPGQRPYPGLDRVLHPGDLVLHPGQTPYLSGTSAVSLPDAVSSCMAASIDDAAPAAGELGN